MISIRKRVARIRLHEYMFKYVGFIKALSQLSTLHVIDRDLIICPISYIFKKYIYIYLLQFDVSDSYLGLH